MNLKALIIDDEPHAREGIKIRLQEFPEIQVLGECSSGLEAVESINKLKPDLLFLDIQMPEINGFEVLKRISVEKIPIVIFVTAYDKYAVKAFEYHALDYLLKPISENRFKEALKNAITEAGHRNIDNYAGKLKAMMTDYLNVIQDDGSEQNSELKSYPKDYLNKLAIKAKNNISIISTNEIEWIESAGDYVYVHSNSKKHIVRETLISLEQKMDPRKFVRIHRSVIVNIEKIKSLNSNDHGDYDVYLNNGEKLKLSRTYKSNFQDVIGNTL